MDKDGPNVRHQHSNEDAEYRRVELITGRKQRRDWTSDEKAKILEASAAPGATVAEVARRYQVSRGLLWTWRRKAMDDLEAETTPHFVPLRIDLDGVGGIVSAVLAVTTNFGPLVLMNIGPPLDVVRIVPPRGAALSVSGSFSPFCS